jgi:hypothetical protein
MVSEAAELYWIDLHDERSEMNESAAEVEWNREKNQ